MDTNKVLDYGATMTGGGLGMEQLYEAANALMVDGQTGQEWLGLIKGVVLVVFGFVAWRRNQPAAAK